MTLQTLPTRDVLKAQAKRLRGVLTEQGTQLSHSASLETIARQWGYRDWNTLSAAIEAHPAPAWQVGQKVRGRYLGHAFAGRIKSVRQATGNHWQLTIVFETPIDVVTSDRFSSLRRQVNATINVRGHTVEKTSNGQPHLVLEMS